MELIEVIRKRRAVRDFETLPIGRATIERLVEAAILAPSAMNLQPWAFAAMLDPARIDSFSERALNWMIENVPDAGLPESVQEIHAQPAFSMFHHAPALLLVMATTPGSQAAEDCCLAAQNLLLAARDERIGSCWVGYARAWLNLPATKKELGLPDDYQVVAPIALGYPRGWPESRGRNAAEIHWI